MERIQGSWLCDACFQANLREEVRCRRCDGRTALTRDAGVRLQLTEGRAQEELRTVLETVLFPALRRGFELVAPKRPDTRLQVARALIFTRAMMNYNILHGLERADPVRVQWAVALQLFGQIGGVKKPPERSLVRRIAVRRVSGPVPVMPEGWRERSALCATSLLQAWGAPRFFAESVGDLVGGRTHRIREAILVRDAFLLERMRPACDERDFDRSLLGFCRTRDGHLVEGGVHEGAITEFVREARKFIWATSFLMEDYAWREGDGSCLARLEALLERGAKGWPMLAELAMAHPETPDTESVRLQLADEEGDPKAGWRWSAEVTGKKLEGETSSTGVLEVVLPRGVKSFGLKVVAPDQSSEESYELELAG